MTWFLLIVAALACGLLWDIGTRPPCPECGKRSRTIRGRQFGVPAKRFRCISCDVHYDAEGNRFP